ncbi:MAG: dihydrofolate reductase, partial [Bacteroidales bacterium]|nr:dihydrofolate reductase [Bacteroidales bacterium]
MTISIIVAMAKNRAIGINNQLIWHNSNDLKHFKKVTLGHCVIMGHNTWLSLPGQKALPNRRNIIISDRLDEAPENFELATSIP